MSSFISERASAFGICDCVRTILSGHSELKGDMREEYREPGKCSGITTIQMLVKHLFSFAMSTFDQTGLVTTYKVHKFRQAYETPPTAWHKYAMNWLGDRGTSRYCPRILRVTMTARPPLTTSPLEGAPFKLCLSGAFAARVVCLQFPR